MRLRITLDDKPPINQKINESNAPEARLGLHPVPSLQQPDPDFRLRPRHRGAVHVTQLPPRLLRKPPSNGLQSADLHHPTLDQRIGDHHEILLVQAEQRALDRKLHIINGVLAQRDGPRPRLAMQTNSRARLRFPVMREITT